MKKTLLSTLLLSAGVALAAPATYNIDPSHTYPSFEADHLGGVSVWRGKFKSTHGTVKMDKQAGTGAVDIRIDVGSLDFGHDKMNEHAKSPDMFDISRFPQATYKGALSGFANGAPSVVNGELTLHGVTKPVMLKINSFKCIPHPMLKKEVCGADASAQINRDEFGVGYGKQFGFKQEVTLRISIEAIQAD